MNESLPSPRALALAFLALLLALPHPGGAREPARGQDQPRPDTSSPSADEEFARRLTAEVSPEALAERILGEPDSLPELFGPLSALLATEGYVGPLPTYVAATSRALGARLAHRGPPWSEEDLDLLLSVALVNPARYVEDPGFRDLVDSILPWALEPSTPEELRDRLLIGLNGIDAVDPEAADEVEVSWGAAPRRSAAYEVSIPHEELEVEGEGRIVATVLSLPSPYIPGPDAEAFLEALESAAPDRELLVLADRPLRRALERGRPAGTHLLETHGRSYTPWIRDPVVLARHRQGGVVVIQRPDFQADREADNFLGRELLQQLPDGVLERWGRVGWQGSRIPFHNGHILLTDEASWISLNSVESPTLARMGLERIPVSSLEEDSGVDAYLGAAREAARELETLFQRPVRFVHPLPDGGAPAERYEAMMEIFGGAGFDLDSLLTILPGRDPVALVADLDGGLALLDELGDDDRDSLVSGYGLEGTDDEVLAELRTHASSARARRLDGFLEVVAAHLGSKGFRVRRLPHVLVPTSLLTDPIRGRAEEFQITWNNVVLEIGETGRRAEGFASLLEAGDSRAREVFASAGYELTLLPPLIDSVIRSGGYRCASKHLREPGAAPEGG